VKSTVTAGASSKRAAIRARAEPSTLEEDEAFGSAGRRSGQGLAHRQGRQERAGHYWKGEKLEFNDDNLTRWLGNFQWVIPQINEFTNDLGNFLGN
jgi:hypothetical protein